MTSEILGEATENQDIFDLGLDTEITARFIGLSQKAKAIIKTATESPEGLEYLGRVMGSLNDEIESFREEFTS